MSTNFHFLAEMGKGPDGRWGGGVILEIFMVGGGSKPFLRWGDGGLVKKFFDHFFPFYKILAIFLQFL